MDAELLRRIAAAVAAPGSRSQRAQALADLIRDATGQRWVGIYTVTDTSVLNEAWSGPGPPAFPTFPREKGLTAHALRARALALSNDVARSAGTWPTRTTQDRNSSFQSCATERWSGRSISKAMRLALSMAR
jgi:putative methionine-R-sulfoxide reductase with GAF domain